MSFELPAGASLDEDGSDLVIKDSGGNIILRYDEGSSEWQFQSETLTGIGSLATDGLTTEGASYIENILFGYPVGRLAKTEGSGSVSLPGDAAGEHSIEILTPGQASSTDENRSYDLTTEFDPSVPYALTFWVDNVTVDSAQSAKITIELTDDPDSSPFSGNDRLSATISGDGQIDAASSEDGTNTASINTNQNNAYVNGLERITLIWDGSSFTVETDDGSTVEQASNSTNYPSGETLKLVMRTWDTDGSNARNSDINIRAISRER